MQQVHLLFSRVQHTQHSKTTTLGLKSYDTRSCFVAIHASLRAFVSAIYSGVEAEGRDWNFFFTTTQKVH